jgi:hypothetical protein
LVDFLASLACSSSAKANSVRNSYSLLAHDQFEQFEFPILKYDLETEYLRAVKSLKNREAMMPPMLARKFGRLSERLIYESLRV